MSVNGVTTGGVNDAYSAYSAASKQTTKEAAETAAQKDNTNGVVYEPSKSSDKAETKKTYKQNTAVIAQLKADAEARASQMQDLVRQMMTKQGTAYGQANNMWQFLASGKYTVDPITQAQAQKDISEDGYWGVSQTSGRILDFATALTGGDPSKIEEMRSAFQKGYDKAAKTWGGSLPDISRRTYDAVMDGFDKMAEETGLDTKAAEK